MGSDSNNGVRHQRALSPQLSMVMMVMMRLAYRSKWYFNKIARHTRKKSERKAAECGIVTLRHNVITTLSQPYKFMWPQPGFSTLLCHDVAL